MAVRVSEAAFRLAYDGEAVREGEMDVADLAPALLGVAQLLKAAGRVVDGDDTGISVRVKTTRQACFEVMLTLAVHTGGVAWEFLKSADGQAAANLLSLLGFTGGGFAGGAIGVVRFFKGKRPTYVSANAEIVVLEVDGDRLEVPDTIARLALDPGVRAALEKVVADPLEKEGISSVSLGDAKSGQTVPKSEGQFFRAIGVSQSDEYVSRYTKPFPIVTLSFKPGQKWRLNDGRSKPLVMVSDANFQAKVDAGQESFAKGDILVCEVTERSTRTPTGFRSEYEITRVLEHQRSPTQPDLGFDASSE